jgi:hypothetical protein
MYLWGAQVEQASDPSSYVPTTTAAVTRNLDALSYPVAGNLVGATGTAAIEGISNLYAAPASNSRGLISLDYGGSMVFAVRAPSNGIAMYDRTGLPITANAVIKGTPFKTASRWGAAGAQMGVVLNGGAIVNNAFDGLMDGTTLIVGTFAGDALGGSLKNIKIYATALTDAQLIALST